MFVVPGPISNPNYAGSHALIKAGAHLLTEIDDVLTALNISKTDESKNNAAVTDKLDEEQKAVFNTLQVAHAPLDADAIAERTKLTIPSVNHILAVLTIQGNIKERAGKYIIH